MAGIALPDYGGTVTTQGLESSQAGPRGNPSGAASSIDIEEAIEKLGAGRFQRRILIAAGLCFAADSMEVLLLSFLAIVLQANWDLTDTQTSTITSSVFLGAMIGTLVLGPLGDRIGRRPVFTLTAAIISVFGMATALVQNYTQLIVVRFLVGFGVGGLTVPFDTLSEMIPTSSRGSDLMLIEYFWTMGTLLVPALAYVSLGEGAVEATNDWRVFVALCSVPCVISTVVGIICVPESPRWLITKGEQEKALKVLRHAALVNGKNPDEVFPHGTEITETEPENSSFWELLSPKWRKTTFYLWLTWIGYAFVYYGTIIAVTLAFSNDEGEEQENDSSTLYSFDYGAIFASASSEIAGTTLILLLIDRVGRIPAQTVSYTFGGIMVLVLCLLVDNGSNRSPQILAAFLARMFMLGGTCATWVSTAEILTTEVRSTGHSAANAIARLSGALCPFVVSSNTQFSTVGGVLFAVSLMTALAAYQLPETTGRGMGAVVSQSQGNTQTSLPKSEQLVTNSSGSGVV